MATSLAAQLQRLAVPAATIYKDDKKTTSLLFPPEEAANKDRDTFYEIGKSGLNELILLDETFSLYEDTLFSLSSKDFERAMQTKEVNENLNQTIEKFLYQLSPYILLQPAHKALEWLINRYHIHQYNEDAILAVILPYHSTKIFVRIIQLMKLKNPKHKWHWLSRVQTSGAPISNQALYNCCAQNNAIMNFIAQSTLKYVEMFGQKASQLNTVYAFFCQAAIGMIRVSRKVSELTLNILLPTIVKAINSPIADFRASSYIVLGLIATKTKLKLNTLNSIIDKLLTTDFDLSYDVTLLVNLLYERQTHCQKMSEVILNNMSIDIMTTMCDHLKVIAEKNISISPLVLAFFNGILELLQGNNEDFVRFSSLPEILLEEIDLKNQNLEKIISCVLLMYHPPKQKQDSGKGDESDIEIIEEDEADESQFSQKILVWYSKYVKTFERQYPEAFDKVIKTLLGSEGPQKMKQRNISNLLGFKPSIAHKVGGAYLFENLNHINVQKRVLAVKYINKKFVTIKMEDADFVKESILNRLNDSSPLVVEAVLQLPLEHLETVIDGTEAAEALTSICSRGGSKAWLPVIGTAACTLGSLDLPINQNVILSFMRYLFPNNKIGIQISQQILSSKWAEKLKLSLTDLGLVKDKIVDPLVMQEKVFNAIFLNKKCKLHEFLDESLLNKQNTVDICLYMILKSCSFDKVKVEDMASIVNLMLESVESRSIVRAEGTKTFSGALITEYIKAAHENKILFEVIQYLLSRVIADVNIKKIPKPWVNVCKNSEMILIRRLYEICITGCGIPNYADNYWNLLKQLLAKFFVTPKEKFEFIANFACGHILYAADSKDVISPELQLRSLKLLSNCSSVFDDVEWMYDSNVVMLMVLLNLNNPLSAIRQCTLELMGKILELKPDPNLVYVRLMQELLERNQEMVLDHDQVSHVLNNIITEKDPKTKVFRRNCLLRLAKVLNSDVPTHIKAGFLKILQRFDNAITFPHILPVLNSLEKVLKTSELNTKLTFDIYESNMFKESYQLINESTITTFDNDEVWRSIETGLKEYRECVMVNQTYTSPSVLIMKQINEETFKNLPASKRKDLVYLIALAGATSNNTSISSTASKVMKKIHINFSDFKEIFEKMLKAEEPDNVTKKKKNTVSMLSYQLTETDDWRLGVTMLEYVQNKKKLELDNSYVKVMFELINKCLRFEEQSCVEYTKQLILSSLWSYCKKFSNVTDQKTINALKSVFKVELIVQCIRGTQNPQTHHHALILLSNAAYMLPEQVLHHIMEIFTFMGTSVLRHDDAYSFQIITKIIETLIPILVKMEKSLKEHSDRELEQLQKRVVPVLRIFADVVLHVPEHRRLPLYKKLVETIGSNQFLWVLIALLLEAHVAHFNENKKTGKTPSRTLADKEAPINRLDFGQNLLLEFPPQIWLNTFVKLMFYVKSLPLQKDENTMETEVDASDIFSVNGHSSIQLRHYKYAIITFMNTCLSSSRFIQHNSQAKNTKTMEADYKTLIINTLTYIQNISKISDEKTAKYWRVMLHHSYDLLDHTNNLLSAPMFLSVIRGLLKHTLQTVRRKSMELLNAKIQHQPEFLTDVDTELLLSLLEPLLEIIDTIENSPEGQSDIANQELELNQQTALLSLKLLTRMLASENPEPFRSVLEKVTEYTCNTAISDNVMASIVLCLAELCANLKAHALVSLRKFMPALTKVLKKQRKSDTPELALLSTVTAIAKIVESLPLFLSPYLQKILYEYSILLAKWQKSDQDQTNVVVTKLANIKKKIAGAIPPRVLIPVVSQTHQMMLEKEMYDGIGPVMAVLADSFGNVTTADFTALQQDLTTFFLNALQLRSDAAEKEVEDAMIDSAEDEVVKALVSLVLKLSETSFRPFYFKIYDWAIRTNVEGKKDRAITFYRLSSQIADKLKGLFVLFAGHFVKNAADLLDACNRSKNEDLYFESENKCDTLIRYVINTLHVVFLYDSQSFLNKDRFETLMQPIVDQLENTVGGISGLKSRATEVIIPCVSQFAVAIADDSLWKLLNYQIMLKMRHNDAEIRLTALDCLVSMATQLGSSWLPLLAESVPFLAELLEDGDPRIENATKDAIRKLEQILGEPLEKYF